REQAEAISRRVFEEWERNEVAAFMPGDTHQLRSVDVRFENASSDLILLPVYLLTYTYRDKKYHFLINGQTGKHYGTKPLSWAKIGLAAAAGIAALLVVAGVLWLLV
ncbi:MAG: zinc ribbon domain-containing protein, partial [Planctomycetota bacterium]